MERATIGQVWTRHCRSSCACPTAFIALSVHHVFFRPMALFVVQTGPGPYLPDWGQGCGLRVLGFWGGGGGPATKKHSSWSNHWAGPKRNRNRLAKTSGQDMF